MVKEKNKIIFIVLFVSIALSYIFYERAHKLRIFILHSDSKHSHWVKEVEKGIDMVLSGKNYITVRHYYMNSKKQRSLSYIQRVSRMAKHAILAFSPDVLLVFDANAEKFVANYFIKEHLTNVIISGMVSPKTLIKYQKRKDVIGVIEHIPVKALREILTLMFPEKKKIYYLSDNSLTGKKITSFIEKASWPNYDLIQVNKVNTFKDWKNAVDFARKKADILLIGTFKSIKKEQKIVPAKKLIQWTIENSKIPAVGLYTSFYDNGGLIAISVRAKEQGYTAAKLGLNLLERKMTFEDLAYVKSQTFELHLNKKGIKTYYPEVKIPIILDAFSKADWELPDNF